MLSPTRFILSLICLIFVSSSLYAKKPGDGFMSIFNGKTLTNWDGDPQLWKVENGCIVGTTTKESPLKYNSFIIWRGGKLANFELKLEYKLRNHNSGIQYRSFEVDAKQGKWRMGGYQADIAGGNTFSGILYGERARGILARRGQKTIIPKGGKPKVVGSVGDSKKIQSQIKKNDWNSYHIIAKGNHLIHKINGITTIDVIDNDNLGKKKQAKTGLLGFQIHQGPAMKIEFKNIRLKVLSEESSSNTKDKR